uniref:Organic cation/carnitine transporter 7-like n=1 Tax=Rhizophora mucronata TaxID=61149 RepID=A0A2P2J0K7_RHIMU
MISNKNTRRQWCSIQFGHLLHDSDGIFFSSFQAQVPWRLRCHNIE